MLTVGTSLMQNSLVWYYSGGRRAGDPPSIPLFVVCVELPLRKSSENSVLRRAIDAQATIDL